MPAYRPYCVPPSGATDIDSELSGPGEADTETVRLLEALHRVARALGAVVFEWDSITDRIAWGSTLTPVLGLRPEEFGLSLEEWVASFAEADRPALREAMQTGAWGEEPVDLPCRLRVAAGGERRVRVQLLPAAEWEEARLLGVVVEEPLVPAEEPEPTDAVVRRIVRVLQHEINNPLAIIMGQAQLLLSDPEALRTEAEVRKGLETVYREGERIAAVVRRIAGAPAAPADARGGAESRLADIADMAAGFRSIVENMLEGVLIVDTRMVIRYANPCVQAITGLPSGALVGESIAAAFESPQAADRVRAHLQNTLDEPLDPIEFQLVRPTGETVWIRLASGPFRAPGGELLGALATISDITRGKRSESELRELALQDPLTGLPNRTLLLERITHALARARRNPHHRFAVLFLDLDHLKLVNDSLGHAAGDELLASVAGRLRACVRPEDTVARIGGDEFAILLEGVQETADATRIAERILSDLAEPASISGYEATTSASIGIVLSTAAYENPEQLLRDADTAMYRAKSLGRGRYELFDRTLHRLATSWLRDKAELRRALERREFRLHYQPIVAVATGAIVGLEALLRWEHPERGLLHPAKFMPLAEESGLILPMGHWVLSHACLRLRAWRDRYLDRAPQWIAVNLSSRQFLQPGLIAQIQEVLHETSLAPSELRLEIQENTVSSNSRVAVDILTELQALGIRVNVDDFGAGYSSLGTLHRLPIEALKIDQSFLRDLRMDDHQTRLVRTILTVAEGVGATTIAEGVSTAEQLGQLQRMGCQYAQGYLFSRPLTAEAVERLLRAG